MQNIQELTRSKWVYQYKRKIIVGIIAVLSISIVMTMLAISMTLRNRLLADSKLKTQELSDVIASSLRHLMLVRNSDSIQESLEVIEKSESSIIKAFILDRTGKVAYSSNKTEIGALIDRFRDPSCKGCHTGPVAIPRDTTMVVSVDGREVLRNVKVIYNDRPCHRCHSPSDRINGKLIIDRSIEPTYSLIRNIEVIILASGSLCLVVLIVLLWNLLSRGVNTYIREILARSSELGMLYMMVERLSKTIEIEELKRVIVETIREIFDADEIHLVLPREVAEYGGMIWNKNDNKIQRRMPPHEDPYRDVIQSWLRGDLPDIAISRDNREVSLPISKGTSRLALIIIKKGDGVIDAVGLDLIKAMTSHIAVAFENAALYRIAITDELTGLYTNRHFRQMIEKKFDLYERYGEKLSILMIDIDNFKQINDTYGHPAGDQVLKDVSRCIALSTRDQDFDFRYGGEEFSVILPSTDGAAGVFVAERIRDLIGKTVFSAGGVSLHMTVSIGVASCPENARTIRELVEAADKALYEAKRSGKNRVVPSKAVPGTGKPRMSEQ